ncbi:hypothetical protein [Cohnella nanjingensis]|uniref:hypothetical protein n=1 Tax=Cohnella nanjingensis TaxID=1387779 RepID=UPI001C88D7A6|nr:hypothetical protein [Cohnella nanjingensis]
MRFKLKEAVEIAYDRATLGGSSAIPRTTRLEAVRLIEKSHGTFDRKAISAIPPFRLTNFDSPILTHQFCHIKFDSPALLHQIASPALLHQPSAKWITSFTSPNYLTGFAPPALRIMDHQL